MNQKPKGFVDEWGAYQPTASVTVMEVERTAKVTFRGDDGKSFRVLIRQLPNPIGFRASFPGRKS